MGKMHGGKGDLRRKLVVPEEVFNSNWDSIFGKKTPKEQYEAKKEAVLKESSQLVKEAPWQPGYEDAVIKKDDNA